MSPTLVTMSTDISGTYPLPLAAVERRGDGISGRRGGERDSAAFDASRVSSE